MPGERRLPSCPRHNVHLQGSGVVPGGQAFPGSGSHELAACGNCAGEFWAAVTSVVWGPEDGSLLMTEHIEQKKSEDRESAKEGLLGS